MNYVAAPLGRRIGAYVIDYLIISALCLGPAVILVVLMIGAINDGDAGLANLLQFVLFLVCIAIASIYWSGKGTQRSTWGHRSQGLRVVDVATLQPVGRGKGFCRMFLLGLIPFAWISPFLGAGGRGWHDMIVKTVVIDARKPMSAHAAAAPPVAADAPPAPYEAVVVPAAAAQPLPVRDLTDAATLRVEIPPAWDASIEAASPGTVPSAAPPAPPAPPLAAAVAPPAPPAPPAPQAPLAPPAPPTAAPNIIDFDDDEYEGTVVVNRTPVPLAQLAWDNGTVTVLYGTTMVGRSPGGHMKDLTAAVKDTTRSISKVHFRAEPVPGGLHITDAGSTNGTEVRHANGTTEEVDVMAPVLARIGDSLVLGKRECVVQAAG